MRGIQSSARTGNEGTKGTTNHRSLLLVRALSESQSQVRDSLRYRLDLDRLVVGEDVVLRFVFCEHFILSLDEGKGGRKEKKGKGKKERT
jgi:hypothetical protein